MKIIGHRGAAGLALENTLESIKAALAYPLYGIEIDVRATADGQLVLSHDSHTGKIAHRMVRLQDVTLAELRKVKLKNGGHIATLDEALALIDGKLPVMLDIKDGGIHEKIAQLLARYPATKIILSGRRYADLQKLHETLPDTVFLAQHHYDPMEIIHRAKLMGAQGICLNTWLINPLNYRLARRQKLAIYLYTVNHRWQLWLFEKLYPDVTIITNHPEKLL